MYSFFFFFNDTATTEIYTLSLHDALPISLGVQHLGAEVRKLRGFGVRQGGDGAGIRDHARVGSHHTRHVGPDLDLLGVERSEEHTSELQSRLHLVCRLLLEKKNSS